MSTTTTNFGFRKPGADDAPSLPTWVGGLADDVDAELNTLWNSAWTDFSSSLAVTGSSTNPSLGNSTVTARYRLLNAHTCMDAVRITIGNSGFSAGSGTYFFSPSHTPAQAEGYGVIASAWFFDSSSSQVFAGFVRITTGKFVLSFSAQSGTSTNNTPIKALDMSATFPVVPASGDELRFSMTYEV